MLFCPPNITFLNPWLGHGLSHCFADTVTSAFIAAFIFVFGGVQTRLYFKYSSTLDPSVCPNSHLFRLQVLCHVLMPALALTRLALQAEVFYDETVYGYMVLSAVLYSASFPCALYLLYLERHRALPSTPTRGHGLVPLVFWTLVFVSENLTFLNLRNEKWWFHLSSLSDKIEFGLFIARYVCGFLLFALGLKAPGIPQVDDYMLHYQFSIQDDVPILIEEGTQRPHTNPSAFSGFGRKIRRLLPFLWPKRSLPLQLTVIACFFILVAGRVINVFIPQYNKLIVNSLSIGTITFRWDYILTYATFWFLQGQGTNSFLNNLRNFIWIKVQQYTVKEVETDMYQHLHSLSLKWHLNRKIGEVLRVMDRGTSSVSSLLSYIVFNILPTFADIFIAVIYFALAFNIWFGLLVFVTMALYLAATVTLTEWRTKFRREVNKLDNEVEAKCVDSLLNFETVKYYNADMYELENYKQAIEKYQVAEWKNQASLNLLNTCQNAVITIGVLSGTLLCAHYVVDQDLTAGDYVLFSTYLLQLYVPLNFFGTYYRMIQTSFVDMENMFTLLETESEVKDVPGAKTLKVGEGCVEFRNVSFSYVPEKQILKDISFTIPAGHTVALVGPTGSGKSTVVRLLFRFYDIQSGVILIDGQHIANVTQKSLRQCIGVVPQDTVLFNNSIKYNIGYGKPGSTFEEIQEAAKAADIHQQILGFPDGYETVVGERGLKLSGGEKQRVAIARTVLKAPSIVILDEATSSLDTQTERNIQASLALVCANKTTLIIAHRLSTIVHADQILVLKEGEIVERGTHTELLEKNGMYASMWLQQLEPEKEKGNEIPSVD